MPRGSLAPFLHYIRSRRRSADGDAELLNRFVADRDEDAFVELVRRHGPLVWGVARQVFGHDQDAEDAFQATFLLLARNAKSVRTAAAVAGWLHGTAWRVANKARTQAIVRRQRERSAPARPHGDPATEIALRELQALLHQEIAALPAKYRTPFVLCVLEGRARLEVAQSLGWNEGTLSTRLAWARKRLRTRLLRRGVDVGAALAAVEVTRVAVPAALANSAVTAVRTGALSAAVSALVHGGVMTTKFAPLAAMGIMLGMVAIGGTGLFGSDPAATPAAGNDKKPTSLAASPPLQSKKVPSCSVTVSGTATGPDGKPVAGASVLLMLANGSQSKVIARAVTDKMGRYDIRDATITVADLKADEPVLPLQVSATADSFAFTWHELKRVQVQRSAPSTGLPAQIQFSADPQIMDLTFVRPTPFQGHIRDEQGNPVSGAEVRLTFCASARVGVGVQDPSFETIMGGALPKSATTAKTDRDGRFRFDDLPKIIGRFRITHPDYTDADLYAANAVPTAEVQRRFHRGLADIDIWTGDINPTLTRPRTIPVRVLDKLTGKPVRTVMASCSAFGRVRYYSYGDTDSDGRVTLRMPPGPCQFDIGSSWTKLPAAGKGYVWHREEITITDAAGQPKEVRLVPVCSLEAEAVDADTGRPLAGANFGTTDRLEPGNGPTFFPPTNLNQVKSTDTSGKVILAIAPGRCHVWAALIGYETVKGPDGPVEFPAGGEVKLRFELRKTHSAAPPPPALPPSEPPLVVKSVTYPVTIVGTATGPDNKPVSGAVIYLSSLGRLDDRDTPVVATTRTDAKGEYEFRQTQVPVRASYMNGDKPPILSLQLCGSVNGLALACKRIDWPTGNRNPTVRMPRGDLVFRVPVEAVGQIVDNHGRPLTGVKVRMTRDNGWNTENLPDSIVLTRTGPDGKFRLGGLPDDYLELEIVDPAFPETRMTIFAASQKVVDEIGDRDRGPHKTLEQMLSRIFVGEIKLTRAPPRWVPVRVVANLTGQPVPNVLTALAQPGRMWISSRGTTDADGRVRLRMPPGECQVQMSLPAGTKYLKPTDMVTVNPTPAEQPLEVRLAIGATVELQAVDNESGLPVRHVQFQYARAADPRVWERVGQPTRTVLSNPRGRRMPDVYPETDKFGKVTAILPPGKILVRPYQPFFAAEDVKPLELKDGGTATLRIPVGEKE